MKEKAFAITGLAPTKHYVVSSHPHNAAVPFSYTKPYLPDHFPVPQYITALLKIKFLS